MTWSEVLEREDLIGGDIEYNDGASIFRGRLSSIDTKFKMIHFVVAWCAERIDPGWIYIRDKGFAIDPKKVQPITTERKRILIVMPHLRSFILFPKGDCLLDSSIVVDLPPPYKRLVARFPELRGPINRTAIQRVVDSASSKKRKVYSNIPKGGSLQDILNYFKRDNDREEFLWHYIEVVTGCERSRKLVY